MSTPPSPGVSRTRRRSLSLALPALLLALSACTSTPVDVGYAPSSTAGPPAATSSRTLAADGAAAAPYTRTGRTLLAQPLEHREVSGSILNLAAGVLGSVDELRNVATRTLNQVVD